MHGNKEAPKSGQEGKQSPPAPTELPEKELAKKVQGAREAPAQGSKKTAAANQESYSQKYGSKHAPGTLPRPLSREKDSRYEKVALKDSKDGPTRGRFQPRDKGPKPISQKSVSRSGRGPVHAPMELEPRKYVEPLPLSRQRIPPEFRPAFKKIFQKHE